MLCAFFWMLTLLCYAKHVAGDGWQVTRTANITSPVTRHLSPFYWLALLFFALCLMSKPMGVTLPCVLLLLDYWPLGRIKNEKLKIKNWRSLLLEKIPFLALSAGACALTLGAQQLAIVSTAGLTIPQRLAHVVVAYNHYLAAMFVPRHLAVYYPYEIQLPAGRLRAPSSCWGC